MRCRAAWLTMLYAGGLFANVEFAAAPAASSEPDQPLRLVIRAEQPSYQAHEVPTTQYPTSKDAVFALSGEIQNISEQDQWLYDVHSTGNPACHLTGPKPVEVTSVITDPPPPLKEHFVLIKAGESLPKRFECRFWTGDAVAPGLYTLSMTYRVTQRSYLAADGETATPVDVSAWTGTLQSNEVMIEVRAEEARKSDTSSTEHFSTKENCEAVGGQWGKHGLFVQEFCVMPTSDYGKECKDSKECEGSCIAELTTEEQRWLTGWLTEEVGQHVLEKTGRCSQWQQMFGCFPFVSGGKVKEILCVD